MIYFMTGFLLATIGTNGISCFCDVLSAAAELVKSNLSVKIAKNNASIQEMSQGKLTSRAIGFAFDDDEEEDYDDEE